MPTVTALDAVDLDRYPIHALDGPDGRRLVERCREALATVGACELPGFLRPDAVRAVLRTVAAAQGDAFRTDTTHNIEFSGEEERLDADDPRRIQVRSAKALIAYDQIDADDPLRRVYERDELTAFVGAALGLEALHRHADPIGALNYMVYEDGDELGWHFDNAAFVVTLMLQASADGGTFEYVPGLRTETDDNPAGTRALLEGDRAGVRTLSPEPGTLALFRGRRSPHRVTPIAGGTPRVNAVLGYDLAPDARLTDSARRIFFGR